MQVTLSWAECDIAAIAGARRQLLALADDRPDRYGFSESDPWGTHIESAASEMAVAKALNQYWIPYARRPRDVPADVGERVQVRKRSKRGWNLLLHPADPDEHYYVLVYGAMPEFEMVGWCLGLEMKAEIYWGDPHSTGRPAFWIPQEKLSDDWDRLRRESA